jgi:Uncharacterized conserved protein
MKVFKVTYTVQEGFAAQNKKNVQAFIRKLKQVNDPALRYHVYQTADGNTFMHFAEYNNMEAQQTLLTLPAFLAFQKERDAHLEGQPTIEEIQFVDATYALFNA